MESTILKRFFRILLFVLVVTGGTTVFQKQADAKEQEVASFVTSYNKDYNMQIVPEGRSIKVIPNFVLEDIDSYRVRILKRDTGEEVALNRYIVDGISGLSEKVQRNQPFYINLEEIPDGEYLMAISISKVTGISNTGTGTSTESDVKGSISGDSGIIFTICNGEVKFYQSALATFNENSLKNISTDKKYLKENTSKKNISKSVRKKAKSITKGCKTKYEKALKIYEWVAENIYYDFDHLNGRRSASQDAVDVLREKKAVCEGYTNLTNEMLRAVGIPAIKQSGAVKTSTRGHAWTLAYIDNRWTCMDVTDGSQNTYNKGKKEKGTSINYFYFDMSPLNIAQSRALGSYYKLSKYKKTVKVGQKIKLKGKTYSYNLRKDKVEVENDVFPMIDFRCKYVTILRSGKIKALKKGTVSIDIDGYGVPVKIKIK